MEMSRLVCLLSAFVLAWLARSSAAHIFLDVADDAQLRELVAARAPGKRVLFFCYQGTGDGDLAYFWHLLAQNFVVHLRKQGFGDNYFALTDEREQCQSFVDEWPLVDEPPPYCAYSSYPRSIIHNFDILTLWSTRYWVLARLAEQGVDAFMVDSDFVFTQPVHSLFALLDTPPLAVYTAVGMREAPLNGGAMFIRGTKAHRAGGALWLMREINRRHVDIVKYAHENDLPSASSWMDQDILGDALRNVQHNLSRNDWFNQYLRGDVNNSFWKQPHMRQPESSPGFGWEFTQGTLSLPNSTCPTTDPDACRRWDTFLAQKQFLHQSVAFTRACTPFDAPEYDPTVPCERLAAAPNYVWTHGEVLWAGWPEATAAVHLLGVEHRWTPYWSGSHAGRFDQVLASDVFDLRLLPRPDERHMPPLTHPTPAQSRRTNSFEEAKDMVTVQIWQAYRLDKLPVLHALNCSSMWIERSEWSRTGILDWRVVQTPDGRCWPANAGFDSCWSFDQFAWTFLLESNHMWNQSRLSRTPRNAETFAQQCSDFF